MSTLTVYFADPWWVGVIEDASGDTLRVARHVFGAEPSGPELLDWVLGPYAALLAAAPPAAAGAAPAEERRPSPKRQAREAARALAERGISTKAQDVLRQQLEQHKCERKTQSRAQREALADYKRQRAKQKALAKHRGR